MEHARWEIPFSIPFPGGLVKDGKRDGDEVRPALLAVAKGTRLQACSSALITRRLREAGPTVFKKMFPAAAVARGFQYVATACPSYPFDLIDKVRRGMESEGNSYIHILSPCPVGWDYESEMSVAIGRLAVESMVFPLYEVVAGTYRLTIDHPGKSRLSSIFQRKNVLNTSRVRKPARFKLPLTQPMPGCGRERFKGGYHGSFQLG